MRSPGRLRVALLAACVTLPAALGARVDDAEAQSAPGQENARRLFDEGVRLESANDFSAALAKFREAGRLRSTPALRFHKALCLENLGKLAAALDEYEAAERAAREQSKAETLRSTQERLEALRPRVPQLSVRLVSPTTGEITLDGVALPATRLDGTRFRVDPGEHELAARAPEHVTRAQKLTLAEGVFVPIELTLERAAPGAAAALPVAPRAAAPAAESPPAGAEGATRARSLALPIATTAGAVALVAGGVVAFALAAEAQSDARATCPEKLSCEDERSDVRTLDALSLAGFVGGAALGVVSVVLWTSRPAHEASAAPARPQTQLRLAPRGLVLEGAL